MSGNSWPQQNPHVTVESDVSEIEHRERIVGQHRKECPAHASVGPTSHSKRDQADAREPAHQGASAGDCAVEQEPDHHGGMHQQDQARQSFESRREYKDSFHGASDVLFGQRGETTGFRQLVFRAGHRIRNRRKLLLLFRR